MKKTQTKEKHPGGRPPKYANLNDLANNITKYFDSCDENRQLPNKAGLCIWLNITRETYNEYRKKPEFSDAIKACDSMIENAWVQRLAGNSPTGAIFYLKNAFREEYRDRHETDLTSGGEAITPVLVKFIDADTKRN
jgi:hypothetical protein